jgi:hypothetical protein
LDAETEKLVVTITELQTLQIAEARQVFGREMRPAFNEVA